MSTAATQQPPVIPPRPNRSQERDQSSFPKVPPRPAKRGPSPNPDRYAPSPLNGGIPSKKDRSYSNDDPIDRSRSVEIPHMVGEEGMEYAALADHAVSSREPSVSPTQTRTVGENMKLHAPKATMPAQSAKQRIMQVTRTDSDKAASFGIGKPSAEVPSPSTRSLKKKASTASGLSQSEVEDEERGIPEIGQHVPLLAHAGDVQAPSPAPGALTAPESKNHKRKNSSRALPPGSYGLHGHNLAPQDKLEKEYYQKHPELLKLEHHTYQHDRATDFSMSREQLNKMVRDSELNGHGVGKYKSGTSPSALGGSLTGSQGTITDFDGLPNEQTVYAAYSEAASRPHSTKPGSPQKRELETGAGGDFIVVEEPNRRRSVLFSDEAISPPEEQGENDYRTPILAEDEVRKNAPRPDQVPAVELSRERRGSDYDMEPPRSRPTSRPGSLYKVDSAEMRSTPLEDVEEYEPLFPEDDETAPEKSRLTAAQIQDMKHRFPSRDIWEDAPNSVHYTAEVSTPDLGEEIKKVPSREQNETPAQAFARRQEELAEKELTHPDAFLWRNQKPAGLVHQPHLAQEAARKNTPQRFPSRDVWEDTPDSLKLETTVSKPQAEQASPVDNKPDVASTQQKLSESTDKPAIPARPKPKPEEAAGSKPVIPERPKPQIPARPAKASSISSTNSAESGASAPAPKAKPAVPARPAGSKIAALQAGFMADLNKKLGLGPQAPKQEEEAKEEEKNEAPKEKAPLSDARKGRARGPQRRAPAPAAAPVAKPAADAKPKLSFSTTITVWSIDPEADDLALATESDSPKHEADSTEPDVDIADNTAGEKLQVGKEDTETEVEPEVETKAQQATAVVEEVKEPNASEHDDTVEGKSVPITTSKYSIGRLRM